MDPTGKVCSVLAQWWSGGLWGHLHWVEKGGGERELHSAWPPGHQQQGEEEQTQISNTNPESNFKSLFGKYMSEIHFVCFARRTRLVQCASSISTAGQRWASQQMAKAWLTSLLQYRNNSSSLATTRSPCTAGRMYTNTHQLHKHSSLLVMW